jgi:hypothetical protein
MARTLATLAAASSESLASPAASHRRISPSFPDLAATTVPRPSARSRIPIVRMSRISAAVGSVRRASRNGIPGAAMSETPTAPLSHPIAWYPVIGTLAAYGVNLDDVAAAGGSGMHKTGDWDRAAPPVLTGCGRNRSGLGRAEERTPDNEHPALRNPQVPEASLAAKRSRRAELLVAQAGR